MSLASDSWRRRAALGLMTASGFAGLGYQIVWTQQCALWLGHEAAAVLAVVAAFFGGLAVGALAFGRRIESSVRPLRWYAACELTIAAWSLLLTGLMPAFSRGILDITGMQPAPWWQWTVAFSAIFLLLLPATAAMGATLPAMERMTLQLRSEGRSIAALYAANTFGAVIGVLAAAFWLVPVLGLVRTVLVCVALNLFCGLVLLFAFPNRPGQLALPALAVTSRQREALIHLALTGLLGIGYEVLVVRVLSQVAEDTVYTFAMLLAVYLIGTALGAAAYSRCHGRAGDPERLRDRLLAALSLACSVGTASLWAAERSKAFVLQTLGANMTTALAAEALLALAAFGPATVVMGALFSHLSAGAHAAGISFGRALSVNTLGAAFAAVIFGVLAFPLLGPKLALLLTGLGYLLLIAWRRWRSPLFWLPASATILLALLAPPLAFVDIPAGGRVVSYDDGIAAAVSVVEDADGVSRLRINNRQQEGSSASQLFDGRQALLPLLLHPAPRRVLFLGLGTGITASTVARDPSLKVDAVELLPEVITASSHFIGGDTNPPRLHLMAADARRYVRTSRQQYDVIVSDNFHPARSGSGSLYTVEHFRAVRERLAAGGVFCQWLPLHQLDLGTLRSILRSFRSVYPNGWAMLANNSLETPTIGLIGRGDDRHFDVDQLRSRLSGAAPALMPQRFGIDDEFAVFGSFIAGPAALERYAAGADLNTDDHPVVAYRAPRITYQPDSLPGDRLLSLLQAVSIQPAELLAPPTDPDGSRRLSAYWTARNHFVESGRNVRPSSDVRAMLAQVREPLLSILHISPDFRPAYDPLLFMAGALARHDVASATALLNELVEVQPARPEAARALEELETRRRDTSP